MDMKTSPHDEADEGKKAISAPLKTSTKNAAIKEFRDVLHTITFTP
jgi:hypothetical protein